MYQSAFQTFTDNSPLFVIAALMLAIVDALGIESRGATFVVGGILALVSHRMVLLDERYSWKDKPAAGRRLPMWSFLWRYGVFSLFFVFVALFVSLSVIEVAGANGGRRIAVVLMVLAIIAPIMAIVLSLFGTVLPAAAVGGDTSISRALSRGRKRFRVTFARLTFGPGLFTVLNVAVALVLARFVNSGATLFLVNFAVFFLSFIPLHLTATTLSLAYRETDGTIPQD